MAQVVMLRTYLLLAALGTKVIISINAQFLDQPIAGSVFVPVDDQITLFCSVNEAFVNDVYTIDWEVRFDNGVPIRAALRRNDATFIQRSFNFTGVETKKSTLTFGIEDEMGNQTNNATIITCVVRLGLDIQERGNETHVIFYSPPPPPNDLNVTEVELGSFNISWSLEFIEGVPVNYTLTVLNLNTTSAQPFIIAGLLDQHYVFEASRPYDVYSFTVTVVTAAGNNTPSQAFIFTKSSGNDMFITTNQVLTTDATTTNGPTGIGEGAIAAIAVSILGVLIIGITIVTLIVFLIVFKRFDFQFKCIKEVQCSAPLGLTATEEEVLVLESKGIKVLRDFEDFVQTDFIRLKQEHKAEIIYQQETNNIFVTTSKSCKILKVSREKKSVLSVFTLRGNNVSPKYLNGLCIHNNKLYVCDTIANEILIFNLKDKNLTITDTFKGFDSPCDVKIDTNNNVYVAERKRIQVLSIEGSYIREIGKGELKNAKALKIVDDNIYVAHKNGASVYSTDGTHFQDIYEHKDPHSTSPFGITVSSNGYVYVSVLTDGGKVLIFKKLLDTDDAFMTNNNA